MSSLLICIISFFICFSQNDREEQLQQILKKHYSAIDLYKLHSIKSIEKKGLVNFYMNEEFFSNGESNLNGTFWEIIQKPDHIFFESIFDQTNASYQQGVDGTKSWVKDGGGCRSTELNKSEKISVDQQFYLIPHIPADKKYENYLTYLGKNEIDNNKYYCISVQTNNDDFLYYYLDDKTYLVGIVSYMKEYDENKEWIIRYYDDYKQIAGLPFPHLQIDKMKFGKDRTTMTYLVESVKINPEIDLSFFEMPRSQ